MSSCFSTPDSYERVYLSFEPMHRVMQERNITDLQLARKVSVKVNVIRNICEALDCGPEDLMTAKKAI